jgi:hypothetical protein
MHSDGTAYVLLWEEDNLPGFIEELEPDSIRASQIQTPVNLPTDLWTTIYISGGRKDKISKGDIAGLFMKQGRLAYDEIGTIEIKQDCAFVGVRADKAEMLIDLVNNTKLKQKKVRISQI